MRLSRRLLLAAAPGVVLAAQAAWPETRVQLVVPFAANGPTDRAARLLAAQLTENLATPVTVGNRPGIVIGTDIVAKSPKDGSVLLFATIAHAIARAALPILPYDPVRDFAPVSVIGRVPMVLLIHRTLPVDDLAGFIAYLKTRPGQLAYGSAGTGSALHLAAALFCARVGVEMDHIPYPGSAPALRALQDGVVDMVFDTAATGLAAVRDGIGRGLMVTGAGRQDMAPALPTAREAGLGDFDAHSWNAVLAPAGTPVPTLSAIARAIDDALALPALRGALADLGIDIERGSTPAEARAFLEAEIAHWEPIAHTVLQQRS
jgi:tripartite-type tricarboxylate transporter receptor subunit TctC